MIEIKQKGDFKKFFSYMEKLREIVKLGILDKYGRLGVAALASATPVDSGETAASWDYEIEHTAEGVKLHFINTNINKGVNIAVILQYGHGTRNGGWVQGRNYIPSSITPVFDKILNDAWEEVKNL